MWLHLSLSLLYWFRWWLFLHFLLLPTFRAWSGQHWQLVCILVTVGTEKKKKRQEECLLHKNSYLEAQPFPTKPLQQNKTWNGLVRKHRLYFKILALLLATDVVLQSVASKVTCTNILVLGKNISTFPGAANILGVKWAILAIALQAGDFWGQTKEHVLFSIKILHLEKQKKKHFLCETNQCIRGPWSIHTHLYRDQHQSRI